MTRWFAIASAALALSGCELLFSLEGSPRDGDPGGDGSSDVDAGAADADPCGPFDEDGDGIHDTCDSCPTAAPAGEDLDSDGLDDGCDPRIGATDRIAAFYGFNTPLASDGWSVVWGSADASVEDGSLRIQTLGQAVLQLPGSAMPAAYTVEVRAAFGNQQTSKLAVFHDANVNPWNVGQGRWCYLFSNGAPMSYLGWELLTDGEPTATDYTQVPAPAVLARFRLGAFRDLQGAIGCTWDGVPMLHTAVTFSDHRGPALFAQVGDFFVDSLVIYEHL